MTKSLLAALAAALTGCAQMETTILVGPRTNREYTELAAQLTVVRKFSGRKLCAYHHESEIKNGQPFNDDPEQTSDFFGCGIRWAQ
jgi:hypothetical protein